jgi:hypothetical protein
MRGKIMAKDVTKKENPLLSKNIPKPPSQPMQGDTMNEQQNGITAKEQNENNVKRDNDISLTESGEEKATIEISLYLRPSQDDKLEDLKREYKRRMKKKISSNQIMRLLIERATIDDLF